jgi:hypothetical protein
VSVRGYILIRLARKLGQGEKWDLITRFESVEGVDFASSVIGPYDFVLNIDTPTTIERTLTFLKDTCGDGEFFPLTINDEFDKHREIQDLEILKNV